jgi:diaminopimelate epimerase
MHGIGNDYIYLDAVGAPALAERADLPALARAMSNRHTGLGSDGLILVCQPTEAGRANGARVRMRMFNADGSESAMCGNGVRCVAKFAHDRLGFTDPTLYVETGSGVLSMTYTLDKAGRLAAATVDMGEPVLELESAGLRGLEARNNTPGKPVSVPVDDRRLEAVIVGTGNPHAVFFIENDGAGPNGELGGVSKQMDGRVVQNLGAIKMEAWGPRLSHHTMFKAFANIHVAAVRGKKTVDMRTWERGSGITQACGTGACAVVVAGVLTSRLGREVKATLPGGTLSIRWDEATNHIFMTGPAEEICTGQWPDEPSSVLATIPVLDTERLTLRPLTHDDSPAVAVLAGDKRISDMTLTVPYPYEQKHATSWISTHAVSHTAGLSTIWAIVEKTTGNLVGTIGIVYNRHNSAEIGYWLGVPFWNKGYTSEASLAVLRYAFELRTPPLQRVDSHHFFGNEASGRVMQKMGMTFEGNCMNAALKHGRALNVARYAITREQWVAQHDVRANAIGARNGQ